MISYCRVCFPDQIGILLVEFGLVFEKFQLFEIKQILLLLCRPAHRSAQAGVQAGTVAEQAGLRTGPNRARPGSGPREPATRPAQAGCQAGHAPEPTGHKAGPGREHGRARWRWGTGGDRRRSTAGEEDGARKRERKDAWLTLRQKARSAQRRRGRGRRNRPGERRRRQRYVEDDFVDSGHPDSNSAVRRKRGKRRSAQWSLLHLALTRTAAASSTSTATTAEAREDEDLPRSKIFGRNGERRVRDRKSTRLNSSHITRSRMPSSA